MVDIAVFDTCGGTRLGPHTKSSYQPNWLRGGTGLWHHDPMTDHDSDTSDQTLEMVLPTETVPRHVWEFAQEQGLLQRAAEQMRSYLLELSTEASIPVHSIETRAKSLASYMEKCSRTDDKGEAKYRDPHTEIDDCVAARVIVYTTRARKDFLEVLNARCVTRSHSNPGDVKHNGYDSDHLVVTEIRSVPLNSRYPELAKYLHQRPGLEVQIRTVAGHAWAEYEHDVRYKSVAYKNLDENSKGRVDQWFIEAGGLRRYLDQVFDSIDEFLLPTGDHQDDVEAGDAEIKDDPVLEGDSLPLSSDELIKMVESRYPDHETGSVETLEDILHQLDNLEVRTVAELQSALAENDSDEVAALMEYPMAVSAARRLDDELLAVFSDRYVDAADPDGARRKLLNLRLRRVRGKFTIYVLESKGHSSTRPIAAARALRELTRVAAQELGPEKVEIRDAIALDRDMLQDSTHPRIVTVNGTEIFVTTNLSRSHAEWLMGKLIERLPDGFARVYKAGDQILPPVS